MIKTTHIFWEPARVTLGFDEAGQGNSAVLLPALSSISTRAEMTPLLQMLASSHRVVSTDWPGFGSHGKPRLDWTPDVFSSFLDWFLREVVPRPDLVVAAGHAATYALQHAVNRPGSFRKLVLIAPTWRGPLPTMAGSSRPWFDRVRAAVDMPVLGPLLYRLNVSSPVLTRMAREHVYEDPEWLFRNELLESKRAVTRAGGARHASIRFVTGQLDRVADRTSFLELGRKITIPGLAIYGGGTPRKSLAEMEALARLPNWQVRRLPKGRLAIHEEFPAEVAMAVRQFVEASD